MGAPKKTKKESRSQIVVGLQNKYIEALGGKETCQQLSLEYLVKRGKKALEE